MNQLTTYGNDIMKLHMEAQQHAASAIQCAMKAGQLLIEAKSNVKHGEWLHSLDKDDLTLEEWAAIASNHEPEEMAARCRIRAEREIKKLLEAGND